MPALLQPRSQLPEISFIESSLILDNFDSDAAWKLGLRLRERLLEVSEKAALISISSANGNVILFQCCTRPGIVPDNERWVARKRNTVLRWGVSTWYMHNKFKGDEEKFGEKYTLGANRGDYAIHGGGFPIKVKGVEGVVAVVVVSGLTQEEDHQVIVETMTDIWLNG